MVLQMVQVHFLIDGFANNYTYDINGGLYSGGPQSSGEVVLPLSGAGTYTITVTDADTGCRYRFF